MNLKRRRTSDANDQPTREKHDERTAPVNAGSTATDRVAVDVQRALVTLTAKMQQCTERLDSVERRIEELAETIANSPSHSDVLEVRLHSAKLAAELARATVELRGEIGMASDEARRAARLAASNDNNEDVPLSLPVDVDLREHKAQKKWSESA